MRLPLRCLLWVPLGLLLLSPSPASAARIDASLDSLLAGAALVGRVGWDYEDIYGGGGSARSTSEVWQSGEYYIYLFGLTTPGNLDGVTRDGTEAFGETRLDRFELMVDLPSDTTWGLVTDDIPRNGITTQPTGDVDCATLDGNDDGCWWSDWIHEGPAPPLSFDGSRLSGSAAGGNFTNLDFYLLSKSQPVLAPSFARFSIPMMTGDPDFIMLEEWTEVRARIDVYAPAAIEPVPEPSSVLMLLAGAGVLARRRWPARSESPRGF
jgi:hypothetical protein